MKDKKLSYKHPLNILWVIPMTIIFALAILFINLGLILKQIWLVFNMLLVRDETPFRKRINKAIDKTKIAV